MLNPNLRSFLKPEVEIRACLRMRSGKRQNRLEIAFFGLNSDLYRFSRLMNTNLSSFLNPEVEIRAFLRMRSGTTAKMGLKSRFRAKIRLIYFFGHAESEPELLFETGSRNRGLSAQAQWKNGKK